MPSGVPRVLKVARSIYCSDYGPRENMYQLRRHASECDMSKQPDRFTAAVRKVLGRTVSEQKIEALRLELIRASIIPRDEARAGLSGTQPRPRSKGGSKASELAAQQIDEMGDPSATDEQRQTRKRRLLKGPREFRDIRGDFPKSKR
jgi:hypothetical protein